MHESACPYSSDLDLGSDQQLSSSTQWSWGKHKIFVQLNTKLFHWTLMRRMSSPRLLPHPPVLHRTTGSRPMLTSGLHLKLQFLVQVFSHLEQPICRLWSSQGPCI